MFSGIVQSIGEIASLVATQDGAELQLRADIPHHQYILGQSIAVNGVCLTLADYQKKNNLLSFQLSNETMEKTTAKNWREGGRVNLESSLKLGDELGGHLVFGHVDGVGQVKAIEPIGDMTSLNLTLSSDLLTMMAVKGSVAVDGCSLTINQLTEDGIGLCLIPHTIKNTIANEYKIGDGVNIEIDMIMRYVARILEQK